MAQQQQLSTYSSVFFSFLLFTQSFSDSLFPQLFFTAIVLQETSVLCLQVLKPVAAATSKVSALKGLSLKESVSQFSSTMTAQADLRVECAHLRRFYNNFASVSQSVTPPYPFPGCETAEVLIETFEPGEFGPYCVDRRQNLPIVCNYKANSTLCNLIQCQMPKDGREQPFNALSV